MRYSSSTDFHRVEARGWPGRIIFMCVVRIIRKEIRNKRCATSNKKVESEQRTVRERLIIPTVVKRSIGVVILYSLARNQRDRPFVPFDDWLCHDKIWSGDESSLRGTAPGYSRRKEWNGRYVSPKSDLHRTWLSWSGRSPCRSHLAVRRSYDVFLWDGPWFYLLGMRLGMCRQNIGGECRAGLGSSRRENHRRTPVFPSSFEWYGLEPSDIPEDWEQCQMKFSWVPQRNLPGRNRRATGNVFALVVPETGGELCTSYQRLLGEI